MSLAGHLLSFLDESAARASADTHLPASAAGRGRALGAIANRILAAIHAHTHRQIALALGERVDELSRAIRENRSVASRIQENRK